MLALIRKDLVTSGQPILIVIGLWIVQWITVLRLENLMTVGAFGTMVLPILIFGTDTSANGEAFTCSLPVRRASIVKARFAVSAVLTLAGLGITWLLALVTRALAPELAAEKGVEFTARGAAVFVVVVALLLGLIYPFLFRAGFRRGMIHCSVATAALLALLTAAEYVVSINQGYEMFRVTPFSGLASGVNQVLAPVGHSMRAVLAVVALAMWMVGSAALSIRVFERREF